MSLKLNAGFGDEFNRLLAIPEVLHAAQHQRFRSLVLRISTSDQSVDSSSIFTNIRLLYPNLTEITYDMLPEYGYRRHARVKITGSVDWMAAFGGLKHIELGICITIEFARDFVNTINRNEHQFNSIEVFKLKRVVVSKMKPAGAVQGYVDKRHVKEFMSETDSFLKQRATQLTSFEVLFQVKTKSKSTSKLCRVLEEENGHWEPYSSFFRTLLGLLVAGDVADECLQLRCEFGFRQSVDYESKYYHNVSDEREFWNKIQNDCSEVSTNQKQYEEESMYSNGPLHIAQLICQIQEKVRENGRGDKVIVKCHGMELKEEFCEFIKFWFKNDNVSYSYGSRLIEFVAR